MSDRKRSVPSYRRHKQSGQAIVTLSDGLGGRHDVLGQARIGRVQGPSMPASFRNGRPAVHIVVNNGRGLVPDGQRAGWLNFGTMPNNTIDTRTADPQAS